jgi:hypothetical protein
MEATPKPSESDLLSELKRLNRTGIINDQEFLVLRKVIRGGNVSPEFYRRFDRLFAGSSKSISEGIKKKKRDLKPEVKPQEKGERLYSFDEAISELNLKLTTLGVFDNSRGMLSCPACGLFEDRTETTLEPGILGVDAGLKFIKISESKWQCPDCGHLFSVNRA